MLKSNTRLQLGEEVGYYVPTMPALISKKRPAVKPTRKKRKDYREIVVEPAKRLAAFLDRLDRKAN